MFTMKVQPEAMMTKHHKPLHVSKAVMATDRKMHSIYVANGKSMSLTNTNEHFFLLKTQ